MPELPEVETTCRGLAEVLCGRTLACVEARVPGLRFPLPPNLAEALTGRRVQQITRRAKYMLLYLDDDQVLLGHLGMSGRMRVCAPADPLAKHDHVIFTTDHGVSIRFNDTRRFGFLDLIAADELAAHPMIRTLGPEPLGNQFNAGNLLAALKGRRTPIKAALLDQKTVAGLGNIYVCEALYWAGISPRRLAASIGPRRAERLVTAVRRVLREAIANGGSSLRDFRHTDGELGYFQTRFAVYDRAGQTCPLCAESPRTSCHIRRIVQSGRSTYYCPREQR